MTKQKSKPCEDCKFFYTVYNPGTKPGSASDIHGCLNGSLKEFSNKDCPYWKPYNKGEEQAIYSEIVHTKKGTWLNQNSVESTPSLESRTWCCEVHSGAFKFLKQQLDISKLKLVRSVHCHHCGMKLSKLAVTEVW